MGPTERFRSALGARGFVVFRMWTASSAAIDPPRFGRDL